MNSAHLHLVVNHLPVFAVLFASALVVAGLAFKKKPLVDAGLVLAVVAAVGALAAVQTGERAEGIVEELAGVSEAMIEQHEEAAEAALLAMLALGAVAVLSLAAPARMARAKTATTWVSLALTFLAFGLVARAANLGGMIRHTEISDVGAPLFPSEVPSHDGDDDRNEEGEEIGS
jgi:uncharacterized membrane protein